MTELNITPGPWAWRSPRFGRVGYREIVGADGRVVAEVSRYPGKREDILPMVRANARAIAALPDCLDALRLISSGAQDPIEIAFNALAKATGETL